MCTVSDVTSNKYCIVMFDKVQPLFIIERHSMGKETKIMKPIVPGMKHKAPAKGANAKSKKTQKSPTKASKKVSQKKTTGKKPKQLRKEKQSAKRKLVKPVPKKITKATKRTTTKSVGKPLLPSSSDTLHYIAGLLAHHHMTPHERRNAESLYDILRNEKHRDQAKLRHYESRLSGVEGALPAFHAIRGRSDEEDEQASDELGRLLGTY